MRNFSGKTPPTKTGTHTHTHTDTAREPVQSKCILRFHKRIHEALYTEMYK